MDNEDTFWIHAFHSPLLDRNKGVHELYCVQCKVVGEQNNKPDDAAGKKILMRCGRCKLVQYCSRACQQEDFASHKAAWPSPINRLTKQAATDSNRLWELGQAQFMEACRCSPESIKEGAYMYEQALDSYIELYEQIRSTGNMYALVPLRSRIPFLLAALGHDDRRRLLRRSWPFYIGVRVSAHQDSTSTAM